MPNDVEYLEVESHVVAYTGTYRNLEKLLNS